VRFRRGDDRHSFVSRAQPGFPWKALRGIAQANDWGAQVTRQPKTDNPRDNDGDTENLSMAVEGRVVGKFVDGTRKAYNGHIARSAIRYDRSGKELFALYHHGPPPCPLTAPGQPALRLRRKNLSGNLIAPPVSKYASPREVRLNCCR